MIWYQSQKKIKITNQHKNINVWESIGANDAVLKQKKNVNFYNIQRENWKAAFFITSLFSHNVINHSKWHKLMARADLDIEVAVCWDICCPNKVF